MEEAAQNGEYDDCLNCKDAFVNVFYATLTWFQIATGDGWYQLMWPLIVKHYYPFVFLIAFFFVVGYGLVNLIVVAILHYALIARQDDYNGLAETRAVVANILLSLEKKCADDIRDEWFIVMFPDNIDQS